jgi:hypothetical protein
MTTGVNIKRIFGSASANQLWGWWNGSWGSWYDGAGFLNGGVAGETSPYVWRLIVCRSNSAGVPDLTVNGQSYACSGTVANAPPDFQLNGYQNSASETSDCEIFAFAAFNSYVPDSVINKVGGAWMWELGVQENLVASHPYRNRPPLIGD